MLAGKAYQSASDYKEKFKKLPFKSAFDSGELEKFVHACTSFERDRCFSADATLFAFIAQSLSNANSCKDAVLRVRSERLAQGLPPCSINTGCYSRARQKLPLPAIVDLAKQVAQNLEKNSDNDWLWKGRHVYLADGSTFSMPDTPENQKAYPQHTNQKKGVGFPLARFVCMTSLTTGALIDFSMGAFIAKGKGELHHADPQLNNLQPNDVLIADRFYLSYFFIALVLERGADFITKNHEHRHFNVTSETKISKGDRIVVLKKPRIPHTGWLSEERYQKIPETLTLRITEVNVNVDGFRTQKLTVVSTLLDHKKYSKEDLAELYFKRWNVELDIRSIKRSLNLNILKCKTPEMVVKEAWINLLTYNLIRRLMAQAAVFKSKPPRQISFTGCLRAIESYQLLWKHCAKKFRPQIYLDMLETIGNELVGNRPGRIEPRCIKRRPHRNYPVLTISREKWKESQKITLG